MNTGYGHSHGPDIVNTARNGPEQFGRFNTTCRHTARHGCGALPGLALAHALCGPFRGGSRHKIAGATLVYLQNRFFLGNVLLSSKEKSRNSQSGSKDKETATAMGNSFRPQPLPAIYGENKTPFKNDILEVGIFVAFAMIAFSFVVIIPGIRGWEVSRRQMRNLYLSHLCAFSLHSSFFLAALMGYHSSLCRFMDRNGVARLQLCLHLAHGHRMCQDSVQSLHSSQRTDRNPSRSRTPYWIARSQHHSN